MSQDIRQGDVGTKFELTIQDNGSAVDISQTTTKTLSFKKPSQKVVTQTATFSTNGTDGKLYYTSQSGDLDEIGVWQIQAYVTFSDGNWKSTIETFNVAGNIG